MKVIGGEVVKGTNVSHEVGHAVFGGNIEDAELRRAAEFVLALWSLPSSRPAMIAVAPSAIAARAVANPMPEPPPVITNLLSRKVVFIILLVIHPQRALEHGPTQPASVRRATE